MADRKFKCNPYYSPAGCGLELFANIDRNNAPYKFDMLCVWRDSQEGGYYYAFDSGCSCPTPFDEFTSLSSLSSIPLYRLEEVIEEWKSWRKGSRGNPDKFVKLLCTIRKLVDGGAP